MTSEEIDRIRSAVRLVPVRCLTRPVPPGDETVED